MLKKLGFTDLIVAVQQRIESGTGKRCYDAVPRNAPSPFYYVQITGKKPKDTKTMFVEAFTVAVHAVAPPEEGGGHIGIYGLIADLEEALTEDLDLPCPFRLVWQVNTGVQTIKLDETAEQHAVLGYEFNICYGFKVKE